jgi:hypothetical protein
MSREQFHRTVASRAVIGWVASVAITAGFPGTPVGPGMARADVVIKDPLRDDHGWTAWDSKFAFSEKGMTPFGVVTRDVKEFPSQFDAAVTVDASKSVIWGFGVAGHYSPESGYTGIGFVASADAEIGVMFARWESDSIVDMMRIDAGAEKMFNDVHRIGISVRDDVAFASINGEIVAKIAYSSKFSGSQIVFASFSDDTTYFRDLYIASTIPAPGSVAIIAAGMMGIGSRRRRR